MQNIQLPSKSLELAVNEISKLPGIGKKNALRLALYILRQDDSFAKNLSESIYRLKTEVRFCKKCHTISDNEICDICANPSRDNSIVCVVENVKDVLLIERTNQYKGLYHVLQGLISPIDGIGAEDIRIKELLTRLTDDTVQEVILALSPSVEGDATSLYLTKLIKPFGIKISRIAFGLPAGADLEYADEMTIGMALRNRTEVL